MSILDQIKDEAKIQNLTVAQLARRADIEQGNLYKIMRDGNPTLKSLEAIAEALGCEITLSPIKLVPQS